MNIHPFSSLVGDQLPTPCFLTLPKDTPQLTLHAYIDDITSATLSDTQTNTATHLKGWLELAVQSQLKGSVSQDFLGPFLAYVDRSRSV